MKKGGKLWIRVFPDKPITFKGAEVGMGGGKGGVVLGVGCSVFWGVVLVCCLFLVGFVCGRCSLCAVFLVCFLGVSVWCCCGAVFVGAEEQLTNKIRNKETRKSFDFNISNCLFSISIFH